MFSSFPSASVEALRNALLQGAGPGAAAAVALAAEQGGGPGVVAGAALAAAHGAPGAAGAALAAASAARITLSSSFNADSGADKDASKEKDNAEGQDDGHEVEDEISYTPYKPAKLNYGRTHPDPVVENATLAAVAPPDITYNLVMPANIISEGKLSNLQLEAVVYGCQRHMLDLPKAAGSENENAVHLEFPAVPKGIEVDGEEGDVEMVERKNPPESFPSNRELPAVRAGFLLGDGAGMGKGRTLAGFVVENIARGRKKHVWISVSSDLYEDAKRDLCDLGMGSYAENNCFNLGKLHYESLLSGLSASSARGRTRGKRGEKGKQKAKTNTGNYSEGVMFATYSTLIGKSSRGTRLEQLVEWCGGEHPETFDGLIMLDECHKAKTVDIDKDGNAINVGKGTTCSQTAAKVVELQNLLPRARVVYCSATSVSQPKNLGFMSRLGLWGPGTEHPTGFNQFLDGIDRLGTGAMELHAMHLKSVGAIVARTLSYSACEFEMVEGVGDEKVRKVYNSATELWTDLHSQLADRCQQLKEDEQKNKRIREIGDRGEGAVLSEDLRYHQELHMDSDSEDEGSDDEDEAIAEQKRLRREFRNRSPKTLKGLFWSAHQRFFRSLCIASKVDKAVEIAKKAVNEDGHCCVIGLQSTGEARSKGAASASGINAENGGAFDDFVSAPNEDLKRIIMQMFPLPPRPKGVIAPEFLNVLKTEELNDIDSYNTKSENTSRELSATGRPSRRVCKAVDYSELNIDDDGNSVADGRKRKQSMREETTKNGGKPSKKHKSSVSTTSMTDLDEESDFTIELSNDNESSFKKSDDDTLDTEDDGGAEVPSSRSRKNSNIPWNEIPLGQDGLVSLLDQVDHERMVRYRKSAEQVQKWLDTVDTLELPANPLDRLLNELGGPDEVAELTGRKTRQVEIYDAMTDSKKVIFEKRKGEGPMDQINVEEKNHFQNGTKKIAILSEAASTGISLQADKRVKNQRRRVHVTLELPWSADKAIQQLGRTHRSNQSTGPIYKFLISEVGGEKRFASAVARRLALLGALTQGDRRATGSANSLGLATFDMDNIYGKRALKSMYEMIWKCSTVSVLDDDTESAAEKLFVEALRAIDLQLTETFDGESSNWLENLLPFHATTVAEETHAGFMYTMLTGCCRQLFQDRVHAIKQGKSIVSYMESLENGTETNDTIKPKIDEELKAAKAAGLNFNVLCNIWLYDVGVMSTEKEKSSDVSRFLNRLLGMNLNRQRFMIQYFLKVLENEVNSAKRAGKYDVGIRTLTGNKLELLDYPRSFCFRGTEAKDDRILLYNVAQDQGTSSETAMELYNEARDDNVPTSFSEWNHRGHRLEIATGFYVDNRRYLRVTPKVFLVINGGAQSDSCITIRPNVGRRKETKYDIRQKLMGGSLAAVGVDEAMRIWRREFELADISANEHYQYSCPGRHKESYIFSGAIVPILNKLLVAAGSVSSGDREVKPYRVVRVETSHANATLGMRNSAQEVPREDLSDSGELQELNGPDMFDPDPVAGGNEDLGKGVAREMTDKIGTRIFRGIITKYKDDNKSEECNPDGTFFTRFTDGSKFKMNASKVNKARKLFEKEARTLAFCGMPHVDICNPLNINTASSITANSAHRQPILSDGDDEDPENQELIFEEKFDGKIPDAIIGLMFDNKRVRATDAMNNVVDVQLWEKVVMDLSKRLISEGVASARQLYNLEKAERLVGASCNDF